MLIAIDGPAGAGKSTVARALARRLGDTYLDSGAMYRCVALLSLAAPGDAPAALAQHARIELGERILLDGRDVTAAIRAPEVSEAASRVAADAGVGQAEQLMREHAVRRLPVISEGQVVGIVSLGDIAVAVPEDSPLAAVSAAPANT